MVNETNPNVQGNPVPEDPPKEGETKKEGWIKRSCKKVVNGAKAFAEKHERGLKVAKTVILVGAAAVGGALGLAYIGRKDSEDNDTSEEAPFEEVPEDDYPTEDEVAVEEAVPEEE